MMFDMFHKKDENLIAAQKLSRKITSLIENFLLKKDAKVLDSFGFWSLSFSMKIQDLIYKELKVTEGRIRRELEEKC